MTTTELVATNPNAVPIHYWSVTFSQKVAINTILLIGPEASQIDDLANVKVSLGSTSDF
jgi:hypothetical protein